MIRVIIADDIPVLRKGLEAVLAQDGGIEVVGTAGNGQEALDCGICLGDIHGSNFSETDGTWYREDNTPDKPWWTESYWSE